MSDLCEAVEFQMPNVSLTELNWDYSSSTPVVFDSVPIIADNSPRSSPKDLTRCLFFIIKLVDLSTLGTLSVQARTIPLLFIGLEGIILSPSSSQAEFTHQSDLDNLIDAIEQSEEASVQTSYLWIPTVLLDQAKKAVSSPFYATSRGDTFRISQSMFVRARESMFGSGTTESFLEYCYGLVDSDPKVLQSEVRFSQKETLVFADWATEVTLRYQPLQGSAIP